MEDVIGVIFGSEQFVFLEVFGIFSQNHSLGLVELSYGLVRLTFHTV
jgi:hypothetical protein